jgi:hypothetical protein
LYFVVGSDGTWLASGDMSGSVKIHFLQSTAASKSSFGRSNSFSSSSSIQGSSSSSSPNMSSGGGFNNGRVNVEKWTCAGNGEQGGRQGVCKL